MSDKTSDKMSDKRLLPCPFCGGEAKALTRSDGYEFTEYVMCGNCEAESGWYKTKAEAIAAWNTRKPLERIMERLEEKAKEPMYQHDGEDYFVGIVSAIEIVKGEM